MSTLGDLLDEASRHISRSDASLILCHHLKLSRETLITHPQQCVESRREEEFWDLVQKVQNGFPVPYVIGHQPFWNSDFIVTPDVLIPRPDTETLIEVALKHLSKIEHPSILELGTGSGAIAITLAQERPDAQVLATDISVSALRVARENATRLNTPVTFLKSDWFDSIAGNFDCVVSNPPYIHPQDEHMATLKYEPRLALTDDIDGLSCIRLIAQDAKKHLKDNGFLIFEHGYDQAVACRDILRGNGYKNIQTIRDLAGNDRVTYGF